jgi:hypothetical protein
LPASAVASLEALETHNELSEKVTPMYWFAFDTDAMFNVTMPAMLIPKSYAVADSPVNSVVLLDAELVVRCSGLVTEPLELCTETGWRVRDLGARMYWS